MGLKLENGVYALGAGGLPEEVAGLGEILQNASMRLSIPLGSFPYGRELGSRLGALDRAEEHAGERALALANEAMMDMAGVTAEKAEFTQGGGIRFTLTTPLGKGETLYGDV